MNTWPSSKRKQQPLLILALLVAGLSLVACNKTEKQTVSVQQTVKKFDKSTVLTGVVLGKGKPMKSGSIIATDSKGLLLASTGLQDSSHYRLDIPADTGLPIVLRFSPEPNIPAGEQLLAVVIDPTITNYDISPLTTAIAKKAEALGGYSRANMVMAAESMVNVPDANKTSTGFRGDPTTQYGGWH